MPYGVLKFSLVLIPFLLMGAGCRPASDTSVRFYLQLVVAGDEDSAPVNSAVPVGQVLCTRLGSVFKWKHYWELSRDSVLLKPGQKITRRMSPDLEVQLDLLRTQRLVVRIYKDGKLSRSRTQPVDSAFCVAGGDTSPNHSWFLVVRRDPPVEFTGN